MRLARKTMKFPYIVHVITPDGAVKVEAVPSYVAELAKLQELVDGYIERWPVRVKYEGRWREGWVNEEGRIKQLPWNERARHIVGGYPVFGNLVINMGDDNG